MDTRQNRRRIRRRQTRSMTAVVASSGVLGLCLLALPDDTVTSLLALGAIAAALVSIAFLVTASNAPGGSSRRTRTPRGGVQVVEWARPRIVPFVDALRGAPLDPALVTDGAASLPSPYRVIVAGHHRRTADSRHERAARNTAG